MVESMWYGHGFFSLPLFLGDGINYGEISDGLAVRYVFHCLIMLKSGWCAWIPFLSSSLLVDWVLPLRWQASVPVHCDGVTGDGHLPERSVVQVHGHLLTVPLLPFSKIEASSSARESASNLFLGAFLCFLRWGSTEQRRIQPAAPGTSRSSIEGLQSNLFFFEGFPCKELNSI
uniref:Uncharacterized protein n=1 Tax=Setaria italica TaxID=4555 RepID=K3ZNE9_SETIT